jgi:hypothetical protein
MTTNPVASSFFQAWLQVTQSRKDDLLQKWDHKTPYTSYILYDKPALIDDVAGKLGLLAYTQVHHGYYELDAVLYRQEDRILESPTEETCLRRIRVAFEHENDFNRELYKEVGRLLIMHCDLRVLVTYPGNKKDWQNTLLSLHSLIRETDLSQFISDQDAFLIILGWRSDDGLLSWQAFVYKTQEWIQLRNPITN